MGASRRASTTSTEKPDMPSPTTKEVVPNLRIIEASFLGVQKLDIPLLLGERFVLVDSGSSVTPDEEILPYLERRCAGLWPSASPPPRRPAHLPGSAPVPCLASGLERFSKRVMDNVVATVLEPTQGISIANRIQRPTHRFQQSLVAATSTPA